MGLVFGIAVYFIIWWTVLFSILPMGLKTQDEEGEVVPGTPGSAPATPQLAKKALITTLVSAVVFAIFYVVYVNELINLDRMPFIDTPSAPETRG